MVKGYTRKLYGTDAPCEVLDDDAVIDIQKYRKVRRGGTGMRLMDAILEGGKTGVDMGLSIIPGVLIICTLVLMLTNSAPGGYTGAAYEGVGFLPMLASKVDFILMPLLPDSGMEAGGTLLVRQGQDKGGSP